jgi:hypothetical protein
MPNRRVVGADLRVRPNGSGRRMGLPLQKPLVVYEAPDSYFFFESESAQSLRLAGTNHRSSAVDFR